MDKYTWDSCKMCMGTVYRPFMAEHMEFHKDNNHHKVDCRLLEHENLLKRGVLTLNKVCGCYPEEKK